MRDHTKLLAFDLADEIAVLVLEDSSLFDRCKMVDVLQSSTFNLNSYSANYSLGSKGYFLLIIRAIRAFR
jgi:hypothetical protein